jgi:hypothetical protein
LDPITVDFLGVLVRAFLTYLGGYLVAHHVINDAANELYVTHFTHVIILSLPAAGSILWGLYVRYRGRRKLMVALMPGVHTEDQVNAIIKSGQATPTVSTPSSTIPGVPAA